MHPSSNMGLQIHLIAIFAFFLQAILAARIVQPVQSFGIIGESSENFSERERIESNNARQYLNSVNIASKSIQEVDDHNKSTIVPHYVEKADFEVENGYSTLPSVPVVNGNKSAVVSDDVKKADSAIGSATTSSDLTGDLTQSSKITDQYSYHQLRNDQPLILNNDNRSESDNNKILNSTNIKSSTESPSDNSEPSSMMPIENGVNVEYSTVVYPTSTTKTEPKPTRIMTQREEMVSESVVKNKYQPMKTKSVKEESNSAKMNSIEDKWRDLEKTFRLYTDSVMKKALPKFLRIHSQLNISSQCNAALLQLVNGLRSFKSWAIKMVDSSGRLPSGTLEGTLTDLGDYDQCLDVVQPKKAKHMDIQGQYCTLEVQPVLPELHSRVSMNTKVLDFGNISTDSVLSDLSHGSALFSSDGHAHWSVRSLPCVADDIQALTAALLKKVPVQVSVRNCEIKQEFHVTIPQFIVISITLVIIALITAGTAIDSYVSRNASNCSDMGRIPQSMLAFSLTMNLKKLMKSSRRNSSLGAVNGVRCLSLLWIVLAHTYGFGHRQGLARLSHAKTYMDDIFFQIITNSWVSVDTFFMLGGLLVASSNLKIMESTGGKINYFSRLVHRVWRLIPPLAATVGIMFILPLIGSGPLWADMAGQKVLNCEKNWWQVLLPINTWVDFSSMCLLHTWYVASDIHFYCVAPLVLGVLYRWPAAGFALLFFITAICAMVIGLLTIIYNLPPTVIFFSPDIALTKRTANLVYFRPYPHLGAYCVGLVLGYLLWKYHKWTLSKMCQTVGWATSATSCLAVLFATYSWSRGTSADPVEGVLYAVLHRTVWAAGVAWVLFICAIDHGAFTPLSRLCYSVYLLHFPVLWVRISWRRSLLPFHHYDMITEFVGILMITLVLSILFHLAFEAPF